MYTYIALIGIYIPLLLGYAAQEASRKALIMGRSAMSRIVLNMDTSGCSYVLDPVQIGANMCIYGPLLGP